MVKRPHLPQATVLLSQKVVVAAAVGVTWSSCQLGVRTDTFYQVLEAVPGQTPQVLKACLRTASVVFSTVLAGGPVSLSLKMTMCCVEISTGDGRAIVVAGGFLKTTDLVLEGGGCKVIVLVVAYVAIVLVVAYVAIVLVPVDAAFEVVDISVVPFPSVVVAVFCGAVAVAVVAVVAVECARSVGASPIDLDFSGYRPPFSSVVFSVVLPAASVTPSVTCPDLRVLVFQAFAVQVWHNYRSLAQISAFRLSFQHPCYHRLSSYDSHYPKQSFHCQCCQSGFAQKHPHTLFYPHWTAVQFFCYDYPLPQYPNSSISFSYHRPHFRNVVGRSRSRFGELRHSPELDANSRLIRTGICLLFYGNCSS